MSEQRLAELLERYFDRSLSVEEKSELKSALLHDPAARHRFWQATEWRALFHQWGEMETGRVTAEEVDRKGMTTVPSRGAAIRKAAASYSPTRSRSRTSSSRRPWIRWAVAAAAIVIFALLVGPSWWQNTAATLVDTADASWAGAMTDLRIGAELKPRMLKLERGLAVIAFKNGARVVLEGPAELELLGADRAALRSGRLRARVPEIAHGFTIQAPGFTVVDLGTEFGCVASPDGSGEVHVLTGAVNISAAATSSTIRESEAVKLGGGKATKMPARPSAFVSEEEMSRRRLAQSGDPLGAWRIASRELNRHPAMVVHFDFETSSNGVLPNQSPNAEPGSGAGIHGPQLAQGRLRGKSALSFTRPDDRLRVRVNRNFDELTLLAWIRPDDVAERQYLVKSTGPFTVGDVDWYLYRDGSMGFGLHASLASDPSRGWAWIHSQTRALKPKQWALLASVIDGAQGKVTHYVNGESVGSGVLDSRAPIRMGEIDIGAAPASPSGSTASFRGLIDEFAILATAMDPNEVRRVYEQGSEGISPGGGE